ncbi:coenzyme Q-binding protein COQ10 homolog A, mitochondrial-like [Diorhabda carinulata]|uniref:coenzyme Q-binding protein COQ10 homolog A, mitochondrial-like n=1 Tax=Diorhabda carinulata TaxID=1163345 RepID=UPI0025A0503F|nr:coenzyme Q-binding protein COQ10 homolog A, mitochondrial-like [Diorhabda carinulata]
MPFSQVRNVLFAPYVRYGIRYYYRTSNKEKRYIARKLVGFARQDIYEVISDVKHYETFLPFCTKSTILKYQPKELHANLEIGFPPIVENYTSHVILDKPYYLEAKCFDGKLFDYLETKWIFNPGLQSNSKTCIIDFSIKFRFKSVFYSHVASIFFDKLVQQMENAFLNETARRYGQPSVPLYILSPTKS